MGEWGIRAVPGKQGLTLAEIQIGSYGEPDERSDNQTGRPRGAGARPNSYRIGGYAVHVEERDLARQRDRSSTKKRCSGNGVRPPTCRGTPSSRCLTTSKRPSASSRTFFTEVEFVAGDVPARWIANTTPDFFEPRQCLLAQVMDESRHMDVFRKRALANGGGLMQTSGGTAGVVGSIDLARDFTEMSSRLHISGEGAVLTMFRMGELMAYNEAEKAMYRLCAQDEARHVAFGVMHMRYMSETAPERREEIQCYLDEAEAADSRRFAEPGRHADRFQRSAGDSAGGRQGQVRRRRAQAASRSAGARCRNTSSASRSTGFGDRFDNGRSTTVRRRSIDHAAA